MSMMTPALAQLIDDLAAPLGAVPVGPGHYDDAKSWCVSSPITPARLIERVIAGDELSGAQRIWLGRLLTLGLLRLLCLESVTAPYDPLSAPASDSCARLLSTGEQLLGIGHGREVPS